jgi:hypothetical protein
VPRAVYTAGRLLRLLVQEVGPLGGVAALLPDVGIERGELLLAVLFIIPSESLMSLQTPQL